VQFLAHGALLSSRVMSEIVSPLALEQINIVVRDMRKSLAFYRLLGLRTWRLSKCAR